MIHILLLVFILNAEVPDNNTILQQYVPPFAKKMERSKKIFEKKTKTKMACAPFLEPIECDALARINSYRMEKGLAALMASEKCTKLAHAHTKYMVELSNKGVPLSKALNHDRFKERVEMFGLGGGKASENVAVGSNMMPDQAVSLWIKSAGHKQNLLDSAVQYTGLSAIKDASGNVFWTQCFSSKK